jgi:hypothetical protein
MHSMPYILQLAMNPLFAIFDLLNDYSKNILSYVGSACLGALFMWWRDRRHRQRFLNKEFPNHVNFSVNYFNGPTLVMRTLMETTADQIWLNPYVVQLVAKAAKNTTAEDPILHLADKTHMDFLTRAVVNELSELTAETFLARSLGQNVATANYVFAVTYEKFKDIRTLKLRVLLIREDDMPKIAAAGEQPEITLRDRLTTLKKMYEVYSNPETRNMLGRVELGVCT